MKTSILRKHYQQVNRLFTSHPISILMLNLPFIIVCSTTLKNAVALSIEMAMIHIFTMLISSIAVSRLHQWLRTLVNVGISFVLMTIARALIIQIFPDITNYVGMYIYLMAVNGMTIYQSANIKRKQPITSVFTASLLDVGMFVVILTLVSIFREIIALGTIWGIALPFSLRISGLTFPFSGFILIGFLLALGRLINKKMLSIAIWQSMHQAYLSDKSKP